jgi:hypothetical protein
MYYNHNTPTTAKGIRKHFGKILEIIALRNENVLHVNLKLKLFKKYHTINSLNVSKIIQHNARKNNSSIIFSEEGAIKLISLKSSNVTRHIHMT